jgi:hypothetical protein
MREGAVLLHDLGYAIEEREIYRLLGYGRQGGTSREDVRSVVLEMTQAAGALIEPKGACIILDREEVEARGPFEGAHKVGFGICTIGGVLEERVRELFASGDYLEGLVLDTIGSVAVESVADSLNYRICSMGEGMGFTGDRRSSPGYGNWSLEWQALFFDLLPHAELGMSLTPSFMMVPRKSISFAVNLKTNGRSAWKYTRCARCGLRDCPYRDHDERGEG